MEEKSKEACCISVTSFALQKHGLSTCASRVVAGELPDHTSFETKLANLYDKEAALTFVSGHATNVSTIAALVEKGDLIIADQLSHNSIQTGAKLSSARILRFKHNDPSHLLHLLRRYRHDYHRCLIITEGHFSMDGDIPDLQALCSMRDQFNALLMVDEAHALGVLGSRGLGSHEHLNIDPKSVDIWMGTLSKSLGSTGGFIAASRAVINHLRHSPGAPKDGGHSFDVGSYVFGLATKVRGMEYSSKLVSRLGIALVPFFVPSQASNPGGTGFVVASIAKIGLAKQKLLLDLLCGVEEELPRLRAALARRVTVYRVIRRPPCRR